MFPILSRNHFDENFSDLTNPTSLLLIRAILYIGCRFSKFKELQKCVGDEQHGQTAKQKTQSLKIKKEIALLYNRAKMVSDANFEWNPLYYILAQFLLTSNPVLTQSSTDFSESVTKVIYMADRLGLNIRHSNTEKDNLLTTEERNMRKRLFWLLITRDRTIALVTSRSSYDSAIKYRSVPLQIEDFSDMSPHEQQSVAKSYVHQVVGFHQLLKDVTKIEICANDAFDDHKPFIHYHRKIDSLVNKMKKMLDKKYVKGKHQSINSFVSYCTLFIIKIFIERLHLLRVVNLVIRCTYECNANKKNGKLIDNYEPPEPQEDIEYVHHWDTLFDSTHQLVTLFTEHVDEYRAQLQFVPVLTFAICLAGLYFAPYMFSDDVEQANLAKWDMDKLLPVLKRLQKDGFVAWNMADMCLELYKNTVNADYGRDIVKTFLIFQNNSKVIFDAYSIDGMKVLVRKVLTPYLELLSDGFKGDYKGIVFVGDEKKVDGSDNSNEKTPSKKQKISKPKQEDKQQQSSSSTETTTTSNNEQSSTHSGSSNPSQNNNVTNPVQSDKQQQDKQVINSNAPQTSSETEASKSFNALCDIHPETLKDQNVNKPITSNTRSESNVGIQISATPSRYSENDNGNGQGDGDGYNTDVNTKPQPQQQHPDKDSSEFDPSFNPFRINFERSLNNMNIPGITIDGEDATINGSVPMNSTSAGIGPGTGAGTGGVGVSVGTTGVFDSSDEGLVNNAVLGDGMGLDLGVKQGSYFPSLSGLNYIEDDHDSTGSLLFNDVSNMFADQ
ncbi:unnamed protein product [Ambrosiozyma monospora]|uniref:Unnamed protein product n=1 Tax=Ambrosiozyma monospora TaxID=43982 RepID=A0ACB5SYJ1_AMBMO|nr:unnamed protein product [Ambrosiozyma monospora]